MHDIVVGSIAASIWRYGDGVLEGEQVFARPWNEPIPERNVRVKYCIEKFGEDLVAAGEIEKKKEAINGHRKQPDLFGHAPAGGRVHIDASFGRANVTLFIEG